MATIVSISLDECAWRELESIKRVGPYSGTSEVFRAALSALAEELHRTERLSGNVSAVLLVLHLEEAEDHITRLKHQFDEWIGTHVHQKLDERHCLEVFVVSGPAAKVREMQKAFQREKKIERVRLVTAH